MYARLNPRLLPLSLLLALGMSSRANALLVYLTEIEVNSTPIAVNGSQHAEVDPGTWIWFTATVQNQDSAWYGGHGQLVISVPGYSNVADTGASWGWDVGPTVYPQGSTLHHVDGYTFTSSYVMVEIEEVDWSANETGRLEVKVQAPSSGSVVFYVRATFTDDSWNTVDRDPWFSTGYKDQQGHDVRRYIVDVATDDPPSAPGTPDLQSSSDTGYSSSDNVTKDTTPTITWSAATDDYGVDGYWWALNDSTPETGGSWTTGTSITPSVGHGTYTIYVKASDSSGQIGPSRSLTFTVDTTDPGVPAHLQPGNGTTVHDTTPLVQWNSSTGAYRYNLVVTDYDALGSGDVDTWTTSTSYQYSSPMQEDIWYWKVRAEDAAGNQSGWYTEWSFTVSSSYNITVTGRFRYEDKEFNSSGFIADSTPPQKDARYATVKVLDSGDNVLATSFTDSTGSFAIPVSGVPVGEQIRVQLWSETQAAVVCENVGWLFDTIYVGLTSAVTVNADGTYDLGTYRVPLTATAAAWNIMDVMVAGYQYADLRTSDSIAQVEVEWESDVTDQSSYGGGVIKVHSEPAHRDEFADHPLLHEYGHHLEAEISTSDWWIPEASHTFDTEMDPIWGDPLEAAWTEGFADYYPLVLTQESSIVSAVGVAPGVYVHPHPNFTNDAEYGSELTRNDKVEGSICGVLWDVYDTAADTGDSYNSGNGGDRIFTIFDVDLDGRLDAPDIYDFHDAWVSRGYDHPALDSILGAHGIYPHPAPDPPASISATPGDGEIAVSWSAVSGAASYNVYYDDDASHPPYSPSNQANEGAPPISTGNTSLTLTGLPNGVTYYISVTAVNGTGESGHSSEVTATPQAPPRPDLIVEFIIHGPGSPEPGEDVTFTVSVRNDDDAAAGVFNVGFWSDRAGAPSIGDIPDQQKDIDGLASRTSTSLIFTVAAPSPGNYKAWAYVDRYNGTSEVDESDETNNAGPVGGHAWTVEIPPDTIPPGNVSGFTANPGDRSVQLAWGNPGDADFAGVVILRRSGFYPTSASDTSASVVYDGTGTSFTDNGVVNGTTYYYGAFTYDSVPNYSGGAFASATPVDGTPPDDVASFTATAGDGQVHLNWANPADPDFSGAKVLRRTDTFPSGPNDASAAVVYDGTDDWYVDGGLTNGITYYYAAFAHDTAPNYAPGVFDSATPSGSADTTPPGNVSAFTATSGDGVVQLSWSNPSDADFAGCRIMRRAGSEPLGPNDGASDLVFDGPGESYSDADVSNGITYYYAVYAHDGVPNYAPGVVGTATPSSSQGDSTPPGRVTGLVASAGNGQIHLEWTNPTDADLAGVKILRREDAFPAGPDDALAVVVFDGPGTWFVDTGLQNGTTYSYGVFAHDASPNFAVGVFVSETPSQTGDTTSPGNVTDLAAAAGDGQITLSWVNPGDPDFAGVKVLRRLGSYPASHDDPTATVVYDGSRDAFIDANLTNGAVYYYGVYAHDNVPNHASGAFESATPRDTTPPENVSSFATTPGDGQVMLSWVNPEDPDFAGVLLVRKEGSSPSGPDDPGAHVLYDGTGTEFMDMGLTNGIALHYAAYAYDGVPNYAAGVLALATPEAAVPEPEDDSNGGCSASSPRPNEDSCYVARLVLLALFLVLCRSREARASIFGALRPPRRPFPAERRSGTGSGTAAGVLDHGVSERGP